MDNNRRELLGVVKNKVARLEAIQLSKDPFDIIEAAGLVRDLLVTEGQGMLVDLVKSYPELGGKRNKRLIFTVQHLGGTKISRDGTTSIPAGENDEFCTHIPLTGIRQYLFDQFMRLPILCIEGDHYDYRDMIKFVANKLGGRHFDSKTGTDRQLLLREIRKNFGVEEFDPILLPILEKNPIVVKSARAVINRIESIGAT